MKQSMHELDDQLILVAIYDRLEAIVALLDSINSKLDKQEELQ